MRVSTRGDDISNDPNFCLKHPGVPVGSDGSDGTSYALTENYTLRIALHTYLLYLVVMYTHHRNDTCVTLFAGAAVMLKPFFRRVSDHRRALLPAYRVTGSPGEKPGSADDKPGSTWERRRHVWEHLESQSCIQFVFSSTYLCIYIATHLHTLCLDWLQAVILRRRDRILHITLSTSVTPASPYICCRSLKMYLIERV